MGIFMDLNHKDVYLNSVWNDRNSIHKYQIDLNKYNVKKINKNFYTAEISYNGLELIFDNKQSMYAYIKLCIFFGKSDCLSTLINKINLNDVCECDKQLFYLIKNNLFNSPYSHYFKQIININNDYKNYDDYIERFNRGAYPQKYKIFEKIGNSYYISTFDFNYNDIPFKSYKEDIKKISDIIINKNNNLTTEQDEYFRNIEDHYKSSKIGNNIIDFKNNYKKCDLAKTNIEDSVNQSLKELENNKDVIFEKLENEIIFAKDDINKIINNNKNLFYSLLDIKVLIETIIKIKKILTNSNSDCTEVSRIFDSINEDIIYSGERSKEIILFEIFFGSYIRKEQYNIYEKICDEISNRSNYNIYQLLMGRGKTSVILPLVALKYILNNDDIINSIICLPSHLVSQTYEEIKDKYSFMLSKYPIFEFSKIERDDFTKFKIFNIIDESNNIFNYKKIIISECNSLKTLKLNYVEKNKLYDPILYNINEKSIIEFYIDLIIFIESNKKYNINDRVL